MRLSKNILLLLVALHSCLFTSNLFAHQVSTSYINLDIKGNDKIEGSIQIRFFDLNEALKIDDNNDGELTWLEFNNKRLEVIDFLRSNFSISSANTLNEQQECNLLFNGDFKVEQHYNEGYAVVSYSVGCPNASALIIAYTAFFNINSDHKALLSVNSNKNSVTRVISSTNQVISVNAEESQWLLTMTDYLIQGVIHIWKGTDHILFLLALLLPCVLYRKSNVWLPVEKLKPALKQTLWIITAFTVAHSITLTLTALNLITLPSRWVEFIIALSVLFAALNNIKPIVVKLGLITFVFGLLHGMGFAGVLGELGLAENQQLLSILAFNIGVEIGQFIILIIIFPLLWYLRQYVWYRNRIMPIGSLLIAIMAIIWCVERF